MSLTWSYAGVLALSLYGATHSSAPAVRADARSRTAHLGEAAPGGLATPIAATVEPQKTQAKPPAASAEDIQAAVEKVRASMTADQAWAVVDEHIKKFCEPPSPAAVRPGKPLKPEEQPPLGHQRTCRAVARTGFSYSETATLMNAGDLTAALPRGAAVFAPSDRNGVVLPVTTFHVLQYDKSYMSKNGPIRLGIWEGTGRNVGKATKSFTWGPRNVDVDFGKPATIALIRRTDDGISCDVLGRIEGSPADSDELLLHVFLMNDEIPRFLAALHLVWPNAKLPTAGSEQ